MVVDSIDFTYDEYKCSVMDRKLVEYVMDNLLIGENDIFQVNMSEDPKAIEQFVFGRKSNVRI